MNFFENPVVANLVAFVIALVAIFIFELMKRPSLTIELPDERNTTIDAVEGHRQAARIVQLKAINNPIYKNWIQRNTATNCRSKITVIDVSGNSLHRNVSTKWTARREPLTISAGPDGRFPILLVDDYLIGRCDLLDIYANCIGEAFAVALKVEGDRYCYLFRGESYRSKNQWRLPQHKIPEGEFKIEVLIEGDNGKSPIKNYRLRNHGTAPDGLTLDDS
jgi:hypothetical protein